MAAVVTNAVTDAIGTVVGTGAAEVLVAVGLGVGLFKLGRTALNLVHGLYASWLRPAANVLKYGSWAVVTGATDGIGKAYAKELALKGLNVVLLSRTQSKLEAVAAEIRAAAPKVEIRVHATDFAHFDEKAQAGVAQALAGLDIGILINNVGVAGPHPQYFLEIERAMMDQLVAVNVSALLHMTRLVLPGMMDRKRGLVCNIASFAAMSPMPFLSVYAATKAFVINFSANLSAECESKGVNVVCELPAMVSTPMSQAPPAVNCPLPEVYAKAAVAALGREKLATPFWAHGAQWWVASALPVSLATVAAGKLNAQLREMGIARAASTTTSAAPSSATH